MKQRNLKYLYGGNNILNTDKNKFYSKTLLPNENGCMEWIGAIINNGYGTFSLSVNLKSILAHRYSYMLHFGEIPKGMMVCHTCDNRKCVAPDHLFLGTHADNMQDMVNKGRKPSFEGDKNPSCKLTDAQWCEIKNLLLNGMHRSAITKKFNISRSQLSAIATGRKRQIVNSDEIEKIKNLTQESKIQTGKINRRFSDKEIVNIKKMLNDGKSCLSIAKIYNVSQPTISCIKNNKRYKNIKL